MIYKRLLPLLFAVLLLFSACGKKGVPSYDSADSLMEKLSDGSVFLRERTFTEALDSDSASLFRMDISDFEKNVVRALALRNEVDATGRLLYVFQMKSADAAALLAEDYYNHYEFAACDNGEKLLIAADGEYALFFKSSNAETKKMKERFALLSGGKPSFEREIENKG